MRLGPKESLPICLSWLPGLAWVFLSQGWEKETAGEVSSMGGAHLLQNSPPFPTENEQRVGSKKTFLDPLMSLFH